MTPTPFFSAGDEHRPSSTLRTDFVSGNMPANKRKFVARMELCGIRERLAGRMVSGIAHLFRLSAAPDYAKLKPGCARLAAIRDRCASYLGTSYGLFMGSMPVPPQIRTLIYWCFGDH